MPYSQSMYENMDDMKYYGGHSGGGGGHGGQKSASGRLKYDVGYGAKYSSKNGDSMYMQRGNNYNAIQDGIAKKDHSKLKSQSYNNY